ncbi:PAS domain S-box protein [Fulvivirga sediminis]|uniref:PAS domain S-box protein n=1 Tax=Fulvivirga sediminis TaxID=2803949 RepID=A0A937F648_9BACT|nr:PAS domain S-box protein [Fulvivirga sediminis]MBL3655726.1 PAS domain S-box protein [Fulvivirga sediminis]
MGKIKFKIGNKIFGGFLVLIVFFIVNASIIFINGNKIDSVVNTSSEIIRPSKEAINDFILLVTRSKMLITNWVYLQSNTDDKEALKNLHEFEYPQLKDKINNLKVEWEVDSQKALIDSAFLKFEKLMTVEKDIMSQLVTFENYEDPLTKLLAEDAVDSQVIPLTASITADLDKVAVTQQNVTEDSDVELKEAASQLRTITVITGLIIVSLSLIIAFIMARNITRPINYIKDILVKLGKGELVDERNRKFSNDEIGEMATAMDNLVTGLRSTTFFAENIGKGNYDSEFNPLSEHDTLGNALIEMRNNLYRVAEEDKKRSWSTGGLAKFGDILRKNNDNIEKLSDDIISNLVKYLGANQGGLYIIEEDNSEDEPYMVLTACYAWDKKKYVDQKVFKGEGLAGQVWLERDSIYLTEVPDNYIKITSGLGDANPRSVLIVPLKVNDEIYGVVEVASFKNFEDYEKEFVEKIAESIASTVSSVKINAKTQKLLEESQEMTEQMRSQEEEMRQNMEELQATQEEMQRSQFEAESTMDAINRSVSTVEFDEEGKILNANRNFLELMGYTRDEILGEHHRILVSKDDKSSEEYKMFWRDLSAGVPKEGEFKRLTKSGEVKFLKENYAATRHRDGSVSKIMLFAYDVSDYKLEGV